MNIDQGLEIHHDGDLPARSGMGSSSSFTVGLLHALYALKGKRVTKKRLADESTDIEQNMIKEIVGSQDQVAAAYGGFNQITFKKNGEIEVNPITISVARRDELNSHLMLFYTGIIRTASDVAGSYVPDILKKEGLLNKIHSMVEKSIMILQNKNSIYDFGDLLNETWQAKRLLSEKVANPVVDDLYKRALKNGAIGGKIAGAGGGGFLLLFVPPSSQIRVRKELRELLHVPFHFDYSGSRIIVYEPHLDEYINIDRATDNNCIQTFRELNTI